MYIKFINKFGHRESKILGPFTTIRQVKFKLYGYTGIKEVEISHMDQDKTWICDDFWYPDYIISDSWETARLYSCK